MLFPPACRPALFGLLTLIGLTASLPAAALSLAEYRSGRTDAANRDSQDAYLYVTFQGMVWYGTVLHDGTPAAPLLFCAKPEELPGEQALADLLQAESSEAKGDAPSTTPMEVLLLQGLQRRFPCK